mgnify:CR=1 FL=1
MPFLRPKFQLDYLKCPRAPDLRARRETHSGARTFRYELLAARLALVRPGCFRPRLVGGCGGEARKRRTATLRVAFAGRASDSGTPFGLRPSASVRAALQTCIAVLPAGALVLVNRQEVSAAG